MGNEFAKELKEMGAQWKDAPETSDLPEGVYSMTIESAELKRSQNTGKLRASFKFTVSEGEHLGSSQYDGFTLTDNSQGMSMLKQFLSKIGVETPESMEDLPDVLADITNRQPLVSAQIKKNGDFTNVRVLEILSDDTGGAENNSGEDAGTEEGEEVPSEEGEGEEVELSEGMAVSFTDDAGAEYIGTITKKNKNGTFDVENDEISAPGMKAEDLTPIVDEEEDGDDETEKDRLALLELATAHELAEDLTEESDIETIIEALSSGTWKEDELEEGEIELLKKYEIEISKPKPKKTSAVVKKTPATAVAKKPAAPAKKTNAVVKKATPVTKKPAPKKK